MQYLHEWSRHVRRWLWSHQSVTAGVAMYICIQGLGYEWIPNNCIDYLLHAAFCICRAMLHSPYSAMYGYIQPYWLCVLMKEGTCMHVCLLLTTGIPLAGLSEAVFTDLALVWLHWTWGAWVLTTPWCRHCSEVTPCYFTLCVFTQLTCVTWLAQSLAIPQMWHAGWLEQQ